MAQTLPKRRFLMPIFPESIFLQYIPMMDQNPFFLPNSPFLTPTFPKEPNLASNLLFLLKCPFPTPIFCKSPILAQTLPKRTFLMSTFPETIFPQYSQIMAQNPSFLLNRSFLTPTFSKDPNLAPNSLFLLECPFPTPIFCERFILAQALPKRTFLMPTFSELFFSQYSPMIAQNPSFLLKSPFLTPNLPKEPNLVQNPLFLLRCLFPTPIFSKSSILAHTLPKRTFLMPTFP